ncbi:MAG: hypothetical protein KGS72_00770 [Cyanobacteria bacterium REEB67]|nr:hypothetical protein [Cyanobacteria bacterium REEB67]
MAKPSSIKLLAALCLQLILGIGVIVGVSMPLKANFYPPAVYVALAVVMLNAAIGGASPMTAMFTVSKEGRREALLALAWTAYISLYLTSCLLCQRLNIGIFHTHNLFWAWSGVVFALIGTFVPVFLKRSGSDKSGVVLFQKVAGYPKYTALIFSMAGFSLANLAWFPLTAIPGMFVIAAWQTNSARNVKTGPGSQEDENAPERQ